MADSPPSQTITSPCFLARLWHGLNFIVTGRDPLEKDRNDVEQPQPEEQNHSPEVHAFLIEEYKHASAYSLNILRDRTQTFNLYIVLLGALSYAFTYIYINARQTPSNATLVNPLGIDVVQILIGLLVFSFVVHIFYYARFVTLNENYRDSIGRMNDIREYYNGLPLPGRSAINKIYSKDRDFISLTHLRPTNIVICIVYTVLELLSFFGAVILFLQPALNISPIISISAIAFVALVVIGLQIYWYFRPWWR